MIEIIPAIMPKTIEEALEKATLVPEALSVQLDIMDGVYVPEATFPYNGNDKMSPLDIGMFELDLMVKNASARIPEWIGLGATRLIFHIEADPDMLDNFQKYGEGLVGVERGIAVGIDTPIEKVDELVPYVDFVQFMGIEKIGYQGVPFSDKVFDKIKDFKEVYPEVIVSVDGGVSLDNLQKLKEAGVDRLVVGSAIFAGDGDPSENLEELENLANS
ncbi:MAG: ribulose-phosphate 3-epimerase [Candidatus Paceibacteria bacterium]|jgi:ribulose-phosphate 3-epimerase